MQQQHMIEPTLEYAQQKDREDKLNSFRSRFYFPRSKATRADAAPDPHTAPGTNTREIPNPNHAATTHPDAIYFCGNSLGLGQQ